MIQKTFDLIGQIDLGSPTEPIAMLDGDALEVNIIRNGERMTYLNLTHFDVTKEGERVPVAPLGIQITIERAQDKDREVGRRPTKPGLRKPRSKAAKKP